jgi:dihydrofolate reductase
MPVLTLLVARALNGAIGYRNKLPWHLPEDLAHFKRTTMGKTIIMGRLTWDSIGRVLPGRQMVVVTRGNPTLPAGVRRAGSLAAAIADNANEDELFVIGGAQIFASAMPIADRIIMTEVNLTPPGDTWMDKPDPTDWREVSRQGATGVNGTGYSIITYARRSPPGSPDESHPSAKAPGL